MSLTGAGVDRPAQRTHDDRGAGVCQEPLHSLRSNATITSQEQNSGRFLPVNNFLRLRSWRASIPIQPPELIMSLAMEGLRQTASSAIWNCFRLHYRLRCVGHIDEWHVVPRKWFSQIGIGNCWFSGIDE